MSSAAAFGRDPSQAQGLRPLNESVESLRAGFSGIAQVIPRLRNQDVLRWASARVKPGCSLMGAPLFGYAVPSSKFWGYQWGYILTDNSAARVEAPIFPSVDEAIPHQRVTLSFQRLIQGLVRT